MRESEWGGERGREERKRKEKKTNKQHPYHAVLKPGPSLFLSVYDKFKRSLSPLSSTFSLHLIYCLSTASLAILE